MEQDQDRWESRMSASTADAALTILKRLPAVRATARKAVRMADEIVPAPVPLELPSSREIFSWIEGMCSGPHRRPGSDYGHRAECWVEDRFSEFGLEDIGKDPIPITSWQADYWSLALEGKDIPCFYIPNTGFTGPEGVEGRLSYVGRGRRADIEKVDLEGRIAVAEVPFPLIPTGVALKGLRGAYYISDPDSSIRPTSRQYLNFVRKNFIGGAVSADSAPRDDVYWNCVRAGALGCCLILKDQPGGTNSHYGPYDGIMKPMPGVWIGKYEADPLRERARTGAMAKLVLQGASEPGTMSNVYGFLPGRSEEVVMVTSHHDSPFSGATEDAAGVAQVLAQALAWSRVPAGKRPVSLAFVVDAGHFYGSLGGHCFAREHPEIMRRTRLLITLEHLGAREVRESGRGYADTGRLALTVMFATPDPSVVAVAVNALKRKPARATAVIPSDFFSPYPTSDASGYVVESGVPVISWIGCPYYLLDEHDTLDKIETRELGPIAETVAELVRGAMADGR